MAEAFTVDGGENNKRALVATTAEEIADSKTERSIAQPKAIARTVIRPCCGLICA